MHLLQQYQQQCPVRTVQLLLCIVLLATSCKAQHHTDLQEQGVKGPVKKITIKNYLGVSVPFNEDSAMLYETDIFYINRKGNIDSTLLLTRSGYGNELARYQKSTVTYRHGKKKELTYNYKSRQTATVQRTAISDSSYRTTILNKENSQTTSTTYYLDQDYVAYKMESVVLDSNKHTLLSQGSERYDKDSSGLYQKVRYHFSDIDNDAKKNGAITYKDFDKYANPGKVILTHLDKPDKVEMRIFSYEYY